MTTHLKFQSMFLQLWLVLVQTRGKHFETAVEAHEKSIVRLVSLVSGDFHMFMKSNCVRAKKLVHALFNPFGSSSFHLELVPNFVVSWSGQVTYGVCFHSPISWMHTVLPHPQLVNGFFCCWQNCGRSMHVQVAYHHPSGSVSHVYTRKKCCLGWNSTRPITFTRTRSLC